MTDEQPIHERICIVHDLRSIAGIWSACFAHGRPVRCDSTVSKASPVTNWKPGLSPDKQRTPTLGCLRARALFMVQFEVPKSAELRHAFPISRRHASELCQKPRRLRCRYGGAAGGARMLARHPLRRD